MRIWFTMFALFALSGSAFAMPSVAGFIDARVVAPGNEADYFDGGLGKLRFGGTDGNAHTEITQAVIDLSMPINSEISTFVSLRWDQFQRRNLDVTEAFIRYRPVSTTPWRWSLKLGAFYPPISMENTDVGWTSPWTITPSAINTWVGEELKTLGGEAMVEWRRGGGTLSFLAGLYEWNDPTGVLLAYRGWAFGDRPTGLFDLVRLPDAAANNWLAPKPLMTSEFKEIDNQPGYYAGVNWRGTDGLELRVLRYDNLADPADYSSAGMAWETKFWSAGVSAPLGDFTLLAQGMSGTTEIDPSPTDIDLWGFQSAYVLLGRDFGKWRLAARADYFATTNPNNVPYPPAEHNFEHGHAYTVSASWEAWKRLRLTGEAMRVDSFRVQRAFIGESPRQNDIQLQLNARLYL